MDKLTKFQKRLFVEHMNEYENDSWEEHAKWARNHLGVMITPEECSKFYLESIFQ